ncbi:hypothetical protein PHMEG_00013800 [Phytophthora megakarya]|uniref:Uncharacterized protein n=1 Tax=Phytophthora megakarya TaxID=4795 RepID=A0A225W6W5_9STRA|nr:hypothetical protein PHMEG_00013800 [Phytophthora megakarya]
MFSYEETCRSIWMLSNHVHRQLDRDEFDGFEDPETMHAAKFRINCRFSDGRAASLKQRIITRRFMENDRMVMVRKAVIAGEGPLSGIQIDESGWTVIRPSPTGSGTIMQVCISQVPLHLNNPVSEAVAHQFNDLLQSIIHESDLEIHAGAEALLIENEMTGFDLLARRRKRAPKKTS